MVENDFPGAVDQRHRSIILQENIQDCIKMFELAEAGMTERRYEGERTSAISLDLDPDELDEARTIFMHDAVFSMRQNLDLVNQLGFVDKVASKVYIRAIEIVGLYDESVVVWSSKISSNP